MCNHTNYRITEKKWHKNIDFYRKADKIASVGYRIYEKALAAAIAKGEAPVGQCPVGGDPVAAR